jgi:hypothetical protein
MPPPTVVPVPPARSAGFAWSLGLAALLQGLLFWYLTGPGLSGTADSAYYLHAAGTLRTVGQLLHPDGTAYRYWPPLYPVLAALFCSPTALRLLHGLALLSSLLLWSRLGQRLLPPRRAMLLPWLLATSTPWLLVSKFVWGETVFLALFAAYAAALYQWLATGQRRWLGLATALGFLLPLTRTAGFFLLLGTGGALLASRPRRPWPVLLHLAGSLLGGLAWHYYALLLAAPSVYRLNRGWAQLLSSAADYGFVLGRWLLPLPAAWRLTLPAALWGLGLLALLLLCWPRQVGTEPASRPCASSDQPGPPFQSLLWAWVAGFVGLIILATTFTRSAAGLHDAERYASVLFGPVALLVLRRWPDSSPAASTRRWLLWLLLGLGLAYTAGRAASNVVALRQRPPVAWPVSAPGPHPHR